MSSTQQPFQGLQLIIQERCPVKSYQLGRTYFLLLLPARYCQHFQPYIP
jgi:hypothetical protein